MHESLQGLKFLWTKNIKSVDKTKAIMHRFDKEFFSFESFQTKPNKHFSSFSFIENPILLKNTHHER